MTLIGVFNRARKRLNWPTLSTIIPLRDLGPIKLGKDESVNVLPSSFNVMTKMRRGQKKTTSGFLRRFSNDANDHIEGKIINKVLAELGSEGKEFANDFDKLCQTNLSARDRQWLDVEPNGCVLYEKDNSCVW